MAKYNVHQAKTNLSRLLKLVEKGEEVIIMRADQPVAKLVRCRPARKAKIKLGFAAHLGPPPPGWDAPMTDAELDEWYGGPR